MKVHLREFVDIYDTVLDFTESRFSTDELVMQIAQRLRENQSIHTLVIENCDLYEKGAKALHQAVLGHQSLRNLLLPGLRICSYVSSTHDEYFFPLDLDIAVKHLCSMFREGQLNYIEVVNLSFLDRTEHHYEHFDMVDPVVMRDILLQEKEPFYINEILNSLNHNPYLYTLAISTMDADISQKVREIEENIKQRHKAENLNKVFQGTHAAIETNLFPDVFKLFALGMWFGSNMRKRKM